MEGSAEIHYRANWRVTSSHPGNHRGMQRGVGYDVQRSVPIHAAGDPRRIDLRASLRDPFGQLLVRLYMQRSTVPVVVLADVSASMGFVGHCCKFEVLIEFVNSLAYSAHRTGDPFAFFACDTTIRDELSLPLTYARGARARVCERLAHWTPSGASAAGLVAGAERAPATRALVFLVSDYHIPIDLLRAVLDRLSVHAVVPVVLVDSAEGRIPVAGIAHVWDAETLARRTVLLRRTLQTRMEELRWTHRERLRSCFADYDMRPLTVTDRFDAEGVNRYFCE